MHPEDKHLIDSLFKILPNTVAEDSMWIAGGAPLAWYQGNKSNSDIDIFFKSHSDLEKVSKILDKVNPFWDNFTINGNSLSIPVIDNASMLNRIHLPYSVVNVHRTPNAMTYDLQRKSDSAPFKLQLISRRYYKNPQEIIDDFDITVCQIVTNSDGTEVWTSDSFARDVTERRLVFSSISTYSAQRMIKYWVYGYRPTDEDMMKIINHNGLDWKFSGDYDHA